MYSKYRMSFWTSPCGHPRPIQSIGRPLNKVDRQEFHWLLLTFGNMKKLSWGSGSLGEIIVSIECKDIRENGPSIWTDRKKDRLTTFRLDRPWFAKFWSLKIFFMWSNSISGLLSFGSQIFFLVFVINRVCATPWNNDQMWIN